ncbi:MAG: DUF2797 domain-containing protein [Treponema sp.]|jgi:hypothetical protein|nr:DUF2797 domain-containing protein [Treponema sp.]
MSQQKFLFVGFSYDKKGPHFIFDDIQTQRRQKVYFDSKTMTIENTDARYCVGTYDLSAFATSPCKVQAVLEPAFKGNHCKNCQFEIGFNPAFYNAKTISPQQARYNSSPHVVYMAYFSPQHIKVGIASERRHSIRLLEQGARSAIVLAKFPNAQQARQLEARLCSNSGILEIVSSDTKLRLLTEEVYDAKKAADILLSSAKRYYSQSAIGTPIDLEPYYFYGKQLDGSIQKMANQKETQVAGLLKGMIGDLVIVCQLEVSEKLYFAVSVKKYISHIINLYLDEVRFSYSFEPKQFSFWDLG